MYNYITSEGSLFFPKNKKKKNLLKKDILNHKTWKPLKKNLKEDTKVENFKNNILKKFY